MTSPQNRPPGLPVPRPAAVAAPAAPVTPSPPAPAPPMGKPSLGTAAARGLAAFIALFSVLNLLAQLRLPWYDPNHWWIDFRPLRPLPAGVAQFVEQFALLAFSVAMLAYAVAPNMKPWRRRATRTSIEVILVLVAWNVVTFYGGLFRGGYHTPFPVAFSLFVAAALWAVWAGAGSKQPARGPAAWGVVVATVLAAAVAFPLLQMVCFGLTDYRRPADVIVVFGAKVQPGGRPSDALADRVQLAIDLYKEQKEQGNKAFLFLSGGPNDVPGDVDEPHAMQRMAVAQGVPVEDTILDDQGLNTEATVHNVKAYFAEPPRVLAVSHFYHLPRVKMTFAQEGMEAVTFTVPVRRPLIGTPKFMAREVAALWKYYFDALRR